MKLTMESKNLLEGLNIVTRALATKSPKAVLEGVDVQTECNQVTLTASDGSFTIRWTGECATEEAGEVVLPGKLLAELVRKLPAGTVHMEHTEPASAVVNIRCLKSKSKLSVITGAYPEPKEAEGYRVSIPQAQMREMISNVSFAIATDESRLILTGGLLEIVPSEIRMVALDGFRLAMQQVTAGNVMPEGKDKVCAVIPGRILNEMSKVMTDTAEECEIILDKGHMVCRFGNIAMFGSLLAGEYIDYKRILPETFRTEVIANIDALSDAIERAGLMAREGKNNLIKLSFTEDSVNITSNAEMGNVEEELEVSTHGEPLDIAFNSNYIRDMLRNMSGEQIILKFNNPTAPCIAVPKDHPECTQLLLPVRTFA